MLACWQWQGFNFSWQADQIRQLMRRFNITYIGIDTTGIGKGVYDLVSKFARAKRTPFFTASKVKTAW